MEFQTVLWAIGVGALLIIVIRFALGFVFNLLKAFLGLVCFLILLYTVQGARVYYAQQARWQKAYAEGKVSPSEFDAHRKERSLPQFLLCPKSVLSGSLKTGKFWN